MWLEKMGFKQIRGYLRKKALFLCFLDVPGAVRALRKRPQMAKANKADVGRFPGQEARHPFVTLSFAALQSMLVYKSRLEGSISITSENRIDS